ncbi:hypothetical protein PFICI_09281 [Pestalotiopsis fici W106-1]|uniref:Protamine P1 n=1 Tax=Pestalotiopsis fici (strain W106-1 / CGMCC3.15140) TaxID=1229662 RepID=W3WZX0_PESFW|nr:uncharacterized protein PFICI_09281 [Pestalotiopsis fici W106-1]ETS79428.1 hypothetical protein PFICI_09281 [Pestalotiopsis fici W106-1]
MASGDIEMENLMGERKDLGEEPIYCAAYDDGEEILYHRSEHHRTQSERVAQRLRYEEHALRFLRGQRPRLISAALRGPFDQASGWRNPWLPARQSSNVQANATNHTRKRYSTKSTNALAKAAIQTHPKNVGGLTNTAPDMQDSMQCHLPSPQSHRELELVENAHFDSSASARIRDWARNVQRDTLERDDFWAPDVGTDDASDGSSNAKRPAKKDWLKSKLNKRRRTENVSFASVSTPTPTPAAPAASELPIFTGLAPDHQSNNRTNANQSFEQTTPSSIAKQQPEESPEEVVSMTASHKSSASRVRPRKKVAVKAHALRRSSRRQSKQPSKNLDDAINQPACQPMECQDASGMGMNSAAQPQAAPPGQGKEDMISEQENPHGAASPRQLLEHGDTSFESHQDQSFRYRAKSTKLPPIQITQSNLVSQQSQITQTGTPDSDEQHEANLDENSVTGCHDFDVVDYPMYDQSATDMLVDFTLQDDTEVAQDFIPTEPTETLTEDCRPEAHSIEKRLCEETSTLDNLVSEEGEQDLDHHQQASHENPVDQPGLDQAMLFLGVENQPTPLHISIFRALEAGSALVANAVEVDTGRTLPLVDAPARPELPKYSLPVAGIAEGNEQTHPAEDGEAVLVADQEETSGPGGVESKSPIECQNPEPCDRDESSTPHGDGDGCSVGGPVEIMQEQNEGSEASIEVSEDEENQEIPVPISKAEWVRKESVDDPSDPIQNTPPLLETTHTLADANVTTAGNEEGELQSDQVTLQSPWVSEGAQVKIEPMAEEAWVSSSRPISIASSPIEVVPQLAVPLSQQQPWTSLETEPPYSAGLQASESLQQVVLQEPLRLSLQSLPEKQSLWACCDHQSAYADQQARLSVSQSLQDRRPPTQAPRFNSEPLAPVPPMSLLPHLEQIGSLTQPATPVHMAQRQTTPEPILSIKSFATFNTPSPKYDRNSRNHRVSGEGLPSTQFLTDATGANPWTSSARSSLRSIVRPRSHLRVSFAPLPHESDDTGDSVLASNVRKAASPPPQFRREADDEDVGANFQKHFDATSRRSSNGTKILQPRAATRLLPSESQQIPMSPGIGLMAQAFREADEGQGIKSSPGPFIAVDESCQIPDTENHTQEQSPWRAESQSQGVDDVAAVLQNLDDFLNPRWDAEVDVNKTRVADGEENFRLEQSPGFLGAIWDAL